MLVKCMLPTSIVENKGFIEWVEYMDPCFKLPTRHTIKITGLPSLRTFVNQTNKDRLLNIPWPNVSCDGWSDDVVRGWNGYFIQGICNEWEMHNIPIEFRDIKGSHTGIAIKKQYNEVCQEFGIDKKVFKIVADGAKNVKKAFKDSVSKIDVQDITSMLIIKQRQLDRIASREAKAQQELNLAIDEMNTQLEVSMGQITKKRKRDEILDDFDELLEELTEEMEEDEEEGLGDTLDGINKVFY